MKVLMFVLNDADLLQPLLSEFNQIGVRGCTIFDTGGMGRELVKKPDVFNIMFGSLRNMLNPDLKPTKTLMLILDDSKVAGVVEAIERVVGNLDLPGSGILYTFTPDFVKGLKL